MRRLGAFLVVSIIVAAVVIPPFRVALLSHAGGMLIASDPLPASVDVIVLAWESREGGAIEAADLYRQFHPRIVVALEPEATEPDRELIRRGVKMPDIVDLLSQLGIPRAAVVQVRGGEAGTTDSTAALAAWAGAHRPAHVVVVVSPTHGRRYRRALSRVWPGDVPRAAVRTAKFSPFRENDWWQSRLTLRDGVFELQKLALDYALHPF